MEEKKEEIFSFDHWSKRDNLNVEDLEKEINKLNLNSTHSSEEIDDSINTWWHGIKLQYLSNLLDKDEGRKDKETILKEIEELKKKMKFQLSSLAPEIRKLLQTEEEESKEGEEVKIITEEGFLDWDYVKKENLVEKSILEDQNESKIGEVEMGSSKEDKEISSATKWLKKNRNQVHQYFEKMDLKDFTEKYSFCNKILDQSIQIEQLFEYHKTGHSLFASLSLTSIIERTITAFIKLNCEAKYVIPKKLSELMENKYFTQILSPNQIFILKCFIGPFSGFNLRNIIWHGFVSKNELHSSLVSLLLLVVLSICKVLSDYLEKEKKDVIPFPPYVNISDYDHFYVENDVERVFKSKFNI